MKLTEGEISQIENHGLTPARVKEQVEIFRKGFPFVTLDRPATINDGIVSPGEEKRKELVAFYGQEIRKLQPVKFVPASGAASRMFKALYFFKDNYEKPDVDAKELAAGFEFIENIKQFPFYEELRDSLGRKGENLKELLNQKEYRPILDALLEEDGMNYGESPKALIKFHRYNNEVRTSIEEQLVEAAQYCKDENGNVNIHFTISPEHQERVEEFLAGIVPEYENRFTAKYRISYSVQKPSTDTIAVDMENRLFRLDDGSLLFRPAGHGALLENLNALMGDIIFIKNIDNVQPDHLKSYTIEYKKVIGAYLLKIREVLFDFLQKAKSGKVSAEDMAGVVAFMEDTLQWKISSENREDEEKLFKLLNRPIRVCGMVRNQGEPGGGPFWVKEDNGSSLQIIEKAQVDTENPGQNKILNNATHFNPVDLVCSIRDFEGKNFDLSEFRNDNSGFISKKSKDGRELKALELPGLWNGAMDNWITLFVEVPLETFSPVKTINDLLREEHKS